MAYEDALQELYQLPLGQFVAERKRLAAELKADGDAAAAKRLLARRRPPISAWVVNQLYWHARDAFDEMLATAEQLRKGHLAASAHHRDAIAELRRRAAAILDDTGHAATDATLRRVTTTLAALSAIGGFDPDPPGALEADRDPPGFEALGIPSVRITDDDDDQQEDEQHEPEKEPTRRHAHERKHAGKNELAAVRAAREARERDVEERRRAEMEQKRRAEQERKRKLAERHELETALRVAKSELDTREREVEKLEKELEDVQQRAADARAAVEEIEGKLVELGD